MPLSPQLIARHRKVLALALPIILSNISEPLLGTVDTAVVGQLPSPIHIGAVAIGATLFSFLFWGFGFLRMGTTGITAQAAGAGDPHDLAAAFARPFLLALALSVPLMILQAPISWIAFEVFKAGAETETLAQDYFAIRIWSAPAALANYVCLGWLLGTGRTGWVLVLQLLLNGANIVLDLVFVLGFGWGVAGVAWATVAAQYLALGLGILIVLRLSEGRLDDWRSLGLFDPAKIRRLLRVNADIFVRTIALLIAFTWFTVKGTELGVVVLAANAVLYNIFGLLAYGLDGFAWAAEALVGRAIGSRDRRLYRESVIDTTIWALILALIVTAATILAGPPIIDLMTVNETVRAAARDYLFWAALTPILGVWCFMLDGIFIGATRTTEMRNGMVISLILYLGAVWLFVPLWGNHGLWAALMVFFIVRTATLGYWLPRIGRAMIGP
jgi:MATE family multidrug resistance protein